MRTFDRPTTGSNLSEDFGFDFIESGFETGFDFIDFGLDFGFEFSRIEPSSP